MTDNYEKRFFNGSNWWCFDFHNHTPASSDYNPLERGGISPRDWLLAYMAAKVDCVAVTDHNCGDWIDALQRELNSMRAEQPSAEGYRPIYIFPGVEITASDGLHILAIYGPEDGVAKIHGLKVLAKCDDHPNNAESMCREGSATICDNIRQTGGVAILAHAEETNGIFFGTIETETNTFTPRRGGREVDQIVERCDAIEVHDLTCPAILHFANKMQGRAIVDGSDAHRLDRAGTRTVWLKMAQPSIEGLRLALLDPESSLLRPHENNSPPLPPLRRIVSVNAQQLYLRRQPLEIGFSPWFNAIIGGRGSGKSTILEALRLSLGRDQELNELGADSDVLRTFKRFKQVASVRGNPGMLLDDTSITTVVEKSEAGVVETYEFGWSSAGFKAWHLGESGNWDETGLSAEQANIIFPVKIFSQKQVFELADTPSALLTYIDSAAEVGIAQWRDKHEVLRSELRELRTRERGLRQLISRKPQIEAECREVSRKVLAYQQSPVATQVNIFRQNQQALGAIDSYIDRILNPISELEELVGAENPYDTIDIEVINIQNPDPMPVIELARALKLELSGTYNVVRAAIAELKQKANQLNLMPEVVSFRGSVGEALALYRAEVDRLQAEGVGTAQEAEVAINRKQSLEAELQRIADCELELNIIVTQILKTYGQLKYHRRLLTKQRQKFVDSVLAGDTKLRITIQGQSDVEQSLGGFRDILRLQENTFIESILSVDENGNPDGILGKLVTPTILDPTHRRVTGLKIGILEKCNEILGHVLHGKFVTAISRMTDDDADTLLEWFPEDKVNVEFRRLDSDRFQSLERASAGQKTSAILSFLLAHGDEPLLLDQPEDDLDNALIYDLVVQQIRNNKSRRQIIVVTHNANIVVNGDAELVIPMIFDHGQINVACSGGLQDRSVREEICSIMEGGKEAFKQRYKRILQDMELA